MDNAHTKLAIPPCSGCDDLELERAEEELRIARKMHETWATANTRTYLDAARHRVRAIRLRSQGEAS